MHFRGAIIQFRGVFSQEASSGGNFPRFKISFAASSRNFSHKVISAASAFNIPFHHLKLNVHFFQPISCRQAVIELPSAP
jgi:hypothetical protein